MAIKEIAHHDGRPVLEACLENASGVRVHIMSYGAIVRDWSLPVRNTRRSVVLGFRNFECYLKDEAHLGAIIGRVANRIAGAEFTLEGKTHKLLANVGTDQLHGGPQGLSRRNWTVAASSSSSVTLSYESPAGEMGYPGDVKFTAIYTLEGYKLRLEMSAEVSEVTPINMVQHHYFNLMGHGTISDHSVQIQGDRYTPLNERLVPTGEIRDVTGTTFDFRGGRKLSSPYDVNFGLAVENRKKDPVAVVTAPDQSLTLRLWSDQPGLQLYTSEYLNSVDMGLGGERYQPFGGLCLEDQMFPDALHHSHFPSILVSPEKPYTHWCEIEIK